MLKVKINEAEGTVVLVPDGELSQNDFKSAAEIIDPYIEKVGKLNGILIHVKLFPGWDSLASLIAHLEFVKNHHKKVSRVALATDSPVGGLAEKFASHFVNAEIKHFSFDEIDAAKKWILDSSSITPQA